MLLDLILTFLNSCQRPHHIEADLTRNLHAFGKQGYFKEDLDLLIKWCDGLLELNAKIEKGFKKDELKKMKGYKNHSLYLDLITVV